MDTYFSSLYRFMSDRGVVIPETSQILEGVKQWMREVVFPDKDIDLSPQTALGRIVEAIALLFVDILGINAQNANGFNPDLATGEQLDSIGRLFGLLRLEAEGDQAFRDRITTSQSIGLGYVQAIRKAVSLCDGVRSVCVLENGSGYPRNVGGIALAPHSIFVCVGVDRTIESIPILTQKNIGEAILLTKSCGCAFTNTSEYSEPIYYEKKSGDDVIGRAWFYISTRKEISIEISARNVGAASGSVSDTVKSIVAAYLNSIVAPKVIDAADITSEIALKGNGIISTSTKIIIGGEEKTSVKLLPYEHIDITPSEVIVNES